MQIFDSEIDTMTNPVVTIINPPVCGTHEAVSREAARWGKTSLTWHIKDTAPGWEAAAWKAIVNQAMEAWDGVCGITIAEATSGQYPDVVVSWGRGRQQQFDGRGNVQAWCELPSGDDRQIWCRVDGDDSGGWDALTALKVMTHEFGHAMGLEHSNSRADLMYPTLGNPSTPQPGDIARVVAMYGPEETPKPPPPPPPPQPGKYRLIIESDSPIKIVT